MKDIFWLTEDFDAARGDEDAGSSDDNNIVSAQDNNIYFYSEVSRPKLLSLNKSLVRVSNSIRNRSSVLQCEDKCFLVLPPLTTLIVVRFPFIHTLMVVQLQPLH